MPSQALRVIPSYHPRRRVEMSVNGATQSLQTQSLLLARYSAVTRVTADNASKTDGQGRAPSSADVKFEASYAALGIRVSGDGQGGKTTSVDSVQIGLSANMTVEDASKILKDRLAEKINDAFKKAGVNVDIREVQKQNLDTSPEATAKRIVDFATSFIGAYAKNHANQDEKGQLEGFMSLIGGAIDKGFSDARDILKGIADISGPISDNIDKTYTLTQKGLGDFHKKQLDLISKKQGGAPQGGGPTQPATADAVAASQKEVTV